MKTALITGASGGIGEALAKKFAKENHNLVLVARSKDKLEALAKSLRGQYKVEVFVLPSDLTKNYEVEKLTQILKEENITVDILVNNAGVGFFGDFSLMNPAELESLLQLNIFALTMLTRFFVEDMRKRKTGAIIQIASTASFQPGPYMSAYYASKAYVLSFSEAISEELKDEGVYVGVVCPGPTSSDFFSKDETAQKRFSKLPWVSSCEQVADVTYQEYQNKKTIIIPGLMNKLLVLMTGFMPRWLVRRSVKVLNGKLLGR